MILSGFLCGFYVENMGCSEGFWEDFMNLMFWKAGTVIVESWTFSESSSVMDKSETVEMGCRPNNWSWQCWQFQGGVLVQHIFLHISSNWAGNKQSLDLKTWKCSSPQKGLGWFLARVLPRRTRSAPSWWAKQREKQDQWTRIQRLQTSRTQRGITTQIKIKSISNSESYESCILEVIGIKTNSREDISGFRQDKTALGRHCWVIWGAFRKVMSNGPMVQQKYVLVGSVVPSIYPAW